MAARSGSGRDPSKGARAQARKLQEEALSAWVEVASAEFAWIQNPAQGWLRPEERLGLLGLLAASATRRPAYVERATELYAARKQAILAAREAEAELERVRGRPPVF